MRTHPSPPSKRVASANEFLGLLVDGDDKVRTPASLWATVGHCDFTALAASFRDPDLLGSTTYHDGIRTAGADFFFPQHWIFSRFASSPSDRDIFETCVRPMTWQFRHAFRLGCQWMSKQLSFAGWLAGFAIVSSASRSCKCHGRIERAPPSPPGLGS